MHVSQSLSHDVNNIRNWQNCDRCNKKFALWEQHRTVCKHSPFTFLHPDATSGSDGQITLRSEDARTFLSGRFARVLLDINSHFTRYVDHESKIQFASYRRQEAGMGRRSRRRKEGHSAKSDNDARNGQSVLPYRRICLFDDEEELRLWEHELSGLDRLATQVQVIQGDHESDDDLMSGEDLDLDQYTDDSGSIYSGDVQILDSLDEDDDDDVSSCDDAR